MKKNFLQGLKRTIFIREGSVAVEFALLIMPYLMLVFAILEIALSFTAEQIFENTTYEIARKIRTGEIKKSQVPSLREFRDLVCKDLKVFFDCSPGEINNPYDFYLDVREIKSLYDIPMKIPRKGVDSDSEIDDQDFDFAPGGARTYNVLRAFYHWPLYTDFMHRYISAVKHPGQKGDFLIMSIIAFKNEPFA
ncbi:TadZ/CpaE-like protein, associated with Flp pilus assembly [Candidatus Liberibacter solanacearum]|uniref:TadE/TadG family type IV pilus assembly protein n=1 Tax=Candidatus Liberibacter solanacearum TaxID=556287 RepID=UPI0038727D13